MSTQFPEAPMPIDAILILSFGGPEGPDDVMPFLHNVLRGRNVPEARMREVAHHYELFGGVSPINSQNRALIASLRQALDQAAIGLPIYWGNRNWHPMLADTFRRMAADGVRRALAFVTSAYGSYSGCRQYREDIAQSRAEVGADAPEIEILRKFFNHPGFIEANRDHLQEALGQVPAARRAKAALVFTAHSIPIAMANASPYVRQLRETCRLVAESVGISEWQLAYQSRSGPPSQHWLEPDIGDQLRTLQAAGLTDVVVQPIGFVSDHLEVRYDLDTEAAALAAELRLRFVRAKTAGTHPAFVAMIRELIEERIHSSPRKYVGTLGPKADACPVDCCRFTAARSHTQRQ